MKKVFCKIRSKTPVPESLFNKVANFAKLPRKHLRRILSKVADLSLATSLKNRLRHRCFSVNIAKFVMCKCMSTTIRVNGTVQCTFCLVMRLNSTIITCCDSLIVILVHWTDETRPKRRWDNIWICQISCEFFTFYQKGGFDVVLVHSRFTLNNILLAYLLVKLVKSQQSRHQCNG